MDEDWDIFALVVEHHSADKEGAEEDFEDFEDFEDEDIEAEKVSTAKALDALETVKLWKLQQEYSSQETLQALDRIGREMAQIKISGAKQMKLYSFFKPKS